MKRPHKPVAVPRWFPRAVLHILTLHNLNPLHCNNTHTRTHTQRIQNLFCWMIVVYLLFKLTLLSAMILCRFWIIGCQGAPPAPHVKRRKEPKVSHKFVSNVFFLHLWTHAYFASSESRVLRLIPCCPYYCPLLRHYDMNDCLSGIRSVNWIQRNVIHYSLQPSRCSGFL